jgi:hypothetical protein
MAWKWQRRKRRLSESRIQRL